MATVNFKNTPVTTNGDVPAPGTKLPDFTLVGTDLEELSFEDFAGKRVVLNIFPSIDTGVCQQSVRQFNEEASSLDNAVVLCVSKDLPFAQARFCGAEGLDNVVMASDFRGTFGEDNGLVLEDGPLKGLLARAVIVLDPSGEIIYRQLVEEITTEPDYDSALNALD